MTNYEIITGVLATTAVAYNFAYGENNDPFDVPSLELMTRTLVENSDCKDCRFFQKCDFTDMSCWHCHEEWLRQEEKDERL